MRAARATAHPAARIEDAARGAVAAGLRRRGWEPRLVAYTGYGAPGWVRVLARVLLAPRRGAEAESARRDPQRGWRAFVTTPLSGRRVTVSIGGDGVGPLHEVVTDRAGYVDVLLPAALPSGWHRISLAVGGCPAVACDVRVADPSSTVGVVSDIDDTVMVTLLPRPLLALWNTFVLREHARRPVPGMARLLGEVAAAHPDALVVYLSTGAWNVAPTLTRFLARHGYPPGPILLTDWGPTRTGWFRDGVAHKRTALRRLAAEFPHVRWVLVGDDGQHDPEIYCAFATECPDKVLAVGIRQLSPSQQVLAHGTPTPSSGADGASAPDVVPWLAGPDGDSLLREFRRRSLLPSGS